MYFLGIPVPAIDVVSEEKQNKNIIAKSPLRVKKNSSDRSVPVGTIVATLFPRERSEILFLEGLLSGPAELRQHDHGNEGQRR